MDGLRHIWRNFVSSHLDMKLTPAQVAEFEEQGYLFLAGLFTPEEMALLQGELAGIFAQQREEAIREKGTPAILLLRQSM